MGDVVELQSAVTTEEYFGGCPECGKNDGYLNTGRTHVFMCKTHRTSWIAGSNLFSSWRNETEAEQRAKWDEVGMEDFKRVEPIYPEHEVARESVDMDNSAPSDSAEDRGMRDLFYALTAYCEWRGAVLPPGIREFMDGAVKARAMPMLVAAREALEAHRVSEDIPF